MNVEQILQIFYLWPVFELVTFFSEHTLGEIRPYALEIHDCSLIVKNTVKSTLYNTYLQILDLGIVWQLYMQRWVLTFQTLWEFQIAQRGKVRYHQDADKLFLAFARLQMKVKVYMIGFL